MGNFNKLLVIIALCGAAGCGGAEPAPAWNCVLCAPDGALSCADPGTDPCPGSHPGPPLPVCGVIPGYSVALDDCGGRHINGLRCATSCSWQLGPDASAAVTDGTSISIPPGCTLPVAGEAGVCVLNCSDCQ